MKHRLSIPGQLASLLKALRKQKKLTQSELGDLVGMSQRSYSQYESRPEKGGVERLLNVLHALDMHLVIEDSVKTDDHSGDGEQW